MWLLILKLVVLIFAAIGFLFVSVGVWAWASMIAAEMRQDRRDHSHLGE
jgi:hypothetical protein